jgi:F-type H+-transporting ATPase subunit b
MSFVSNPAFWVVLSTIVFLLIVFFKSYKLIAAYFDKQQDDIKMTIIEAESVYNKANTLYQEYVKRMTDLEVEAEKILESAHNEARNIIGSAEDTVAKIVFKKQQELSRRISEYETQLTNQILLKYADIIVDDLQELAKGKLPISSGLNSETVN